MQEVQPETALERALLDREEQLERVERDLMREREDRKARVQDLQKKLNASVQVHYFGSVIFSMYGLQSR